MPPRHRNTSDDCWGVAQDRDRWSQKTAFESSQVVLAVARVELQWHRPHRPHCSG